MTRFCAAYYLANYCALLLYPLYRLLYSSAQVQPLLLSDSLGPLSLTVSELQSRGSDLDSLLRLSLYLLRQISHPRPLLLPGLHSRQARRPPSLFLH